MQHRKVWKVWLDGDANVNIRRHKSQVQYGRLCAAVSQLMCSLQFTVQLNGACARVVGILSAFDGGVDVSRHAQHRYSH